MPSPTEEIITISGTAEEIIFKNPDNGYIVVMMDINGSPETAVGNLGDISEGESLILRGNYIESAKYGRQFKAVTCERKLPTTPEEIKKGGLDAYFIDHTLGIYPASASGVPFTAAYIQSKGDILTDLTEDMAAEQKARTTYDNILRFADDPDVREPIKFLREREIVHFQRFGEGLRLATDKMDSKNFYAINPAFDK